MMVIVKPTVLNRNKLIISTFLLPLYFVFAICIAHQIKKGNVAHYMDTVPEILKLPYDHISIRVAKNS